MHTWRGLEKGNSITMDAIRKFSNFYLLKNSHQLLTAQRNGRLLLTICSGTRNLSDFWKVTEHCTKHISDSLSWGTEEMPHEDTHPPLVHGIYFWTKVQINPVSLLFHWGKEKWGSHGWHYLWILHFCTCHRGVLKWLVKQRRVFRG